MKQHTEGRKVGPVRVTPAARLETWRRVQLSVCRWIYLENICHLLCHYTTNYQQLATVLSINEYTLFKKYHFKQYLSEHKNSVM